MEQAGHDYLKDIELDLDGPSAQTLGYVHSIETAGTVDGPGVRTVVWTTGCVLRCLYCHNPDTWHLKAGRPMALEDVTGEIAKYASSLKLMHGGVTLSGGEPLIQAPFTALDTSGFLGSRADDAMLGDIDLVLLDIKSWDPETYRHVTGRELQPTLDFARRLADLGKPVWLRFVLVPDLTDAPADIRGIADFAAALGNIQRVEVLPFHQLGAAKWQALGYDYLLARTPPPTDDQVDAARAVFRERELEVH